MNYSFIGLAILIADVYAIYQVFTSSVQTSHKILWTLGILIFPVVGFIVWLLAGPRGAAVKI